MTVLVLYRSWHVGARLIHRLSGVSDVTVLMGLGAADESVELVAELKPRIVVIDAQLSHGAGIEVLQKVKSFVPPPIVIMTASSPYNQYRRKCLRNGADLYFRIPEEIDQLSKAVVGLTERSLASDG